MAVSHSSFLAVCCTQANGLDIVGLTREEAVAHLTGLEGHVTLVVQYRKEGQLSPLST